MTEAEKAAHARGDREGYDRAIEFLRACGTDDRERAARFLENVRDRRFATVATAVEKEAAPCQ